VFRPVILVDAPDVLPQRDAPDEDQEKRDADGAVNQIEDDLISHYRRQALKLGRGDERNKLVKNDEEPNRKQNVEGDDPTAQFELLFVFFDRDIIEGGVGGEPQSAEA